MYNETRKKLFIETYSEHVTTTYIQSLFNNTREYEELLQKDVGDLLFPEIISLLKSFNSSSKETLRYKTSLLRTYATWCIDNGMSIDNMNHYNEVTTANLSGCVNKFISSNLYPTREDVMYYLDNLVNLCDKVLLLGIFEGIKGDQYCELSQMKEEDLNFKDSTITLCTGRVVKVSKELLNYASMSAKEYVYISVNEEGRMFNTSLEETSKVLKARVNCSEDTIASSYKRLAKRLSKLKTDLDAPLLTVPRLFNGGVIDSVKKRAKELNMNPLDLLASEHFQPIAIQYNITDKPLYQLRNTYKDYL